MFHSPTPCAPFLSSNFISPLTSTSTVDGEHVSDTPSTIQSLSSSLLDSVVFDEEFEASQQQQPHETVGVSINTLELLISEVNSLKIQVHFVSVC